MGYNLEKKMFALLIVAASVLSVSAQPFSLTFTGDVEVDFPESQNAQNKDFASGKYEIQTVADAFDVGVPPGISQSGWDIKDMRFQYDYANDALHIGLNCFGVCGDADGDGDEGRSGAVLTDNGGVDLPNFLNSETTIAAMCAARPTTRRATRPAWIAHACQTARVSTTRATCSAAMALRASIAKASCSARRATISAMCATATVSRACQCRNHSTCALAATLIAASSSRATRSTASTQTTAARTLPARNTRPQWRKTATSSLRPSTRPRGRASCRLTTAP